MTEIRTEKKPPVHEKPEYRKSLIPDNLEEMRNVLGDLIDEIGKEKNYIVKDEVLGSLNNLNAFNFCESIPLLINQIKGTLYILAKRIKQDFIIRTTELAKEKDDFFKFTITIVYQRNDKDNYDNSEKENSGYISAIYWSKRNAIVENGKVKKYIYKKIQNQSTKDPNSYNRTSFSQQGAPKWQIDECMKCDKKLAVIRNVMNRLSEIKRSLYWCSVISNDLVNDLIKVANEQKFKLSADLKSEEKELTPEERERIEDYEYYEQLKKFKTKDEMFKFMFEYAQKHSQDPDAVEFRKKIKGESEN